MAQIKVSIAENITIQSVSVNEQWGALDVTVVQVADGPVLDAFESLTSGVSQEETKSSIRLFPVNHKRFGKEATADELVKLTIAEEKAFLEALLSAYHPTAKMNYSKMFEGSGITSAEDIKTKITDEAVMKTISTNLYKAFVEAMKGHDSSIKNRVKFYRQSDAKNLVTFPKAIGFKKGSFESFKTPFIESMVIPVEQSKLKYSDYEISKGKNNSEAVTADAPSDSALPFEL